MHAVRRMLEQYVSSFLYNGVDFLRQGFVDSRCRGQAIRPRDAAEHLSQCPSWRHNRRCQDMPTCPYFHEGADCIRFYVQGECPYNARCRWAHRNVSAHRETTRHSSPAREAPLPVAEAPRDVHRRAPKSSMELPPEWRAIESSAGDYFYFNTITGERTWEPPMHRRPSPPTPLHRPDRSWPPPQGSHAPYSDYERAEPRDHYSPSYSAAPYDSAGRWPAQRGRSPPPSATSTRTASAGSLQRRPLSPHSRPQPAAPAASSRRAQSPTRTIVRHRRSQSPTRPAERRPAAPTAAAAPIRDTKPARKSPPKVVPASSSSSAPAQPAAAKGDLKAQSTDSVPLLTSSNALNSSAASQPSPKEALETPPGSPPRSSSLSMVQATHPVVPALGRLHVSRAIGGSSLYEHSMRIQRATHIVDPLADAALAASEAAEVASAQRQLESAQETCLFCTSTPEWALLGAHLSRGMCSMCSQRSSVPPPLMTDAAAASAFERAQQQISQ